MDAANVSAAASDVEVFVDAADSIEATDGPLPSCNPPPAVTIPTESILVTSSYVIVPPTDKLPPTCILNATPTPPLITNDPVDTEVELVVSVYVLTPLICKFLNTDVQGQ